MTGSAPTLQAMTLEEALAEAGRRGYSMSYSNRRYRMYDSAGRQIGTGVGWADLCSRMFALGYSVVERDDTAELVEALERCQHRLALHVEQVEMQHMGMPKDAPTRVQFEEDVVALDQSRAALAKWKERNP